MALLKKIELRKQKARNIERKAQITIITVNVLIILVLPTLQDG